MGVLRGCAVECPVNVARALTFVLPGDIRTRTGGYEYDRQVIAALRERGWDVTVCQLGDGFPMPSREVRMQAAMMLTFIPDGSLVVIDGLALGALPDEVASHMGRLRLVALVHHPLAREAGLGADEAAALYRSEQRALACVRRVVVTSPATADALADYGVRRAEIAVAVPGTGRAPLASGSRGPGARLLCVASIVPRKGHDVLVQALAGLSHLPWHLVCVGSADRDASWTARLRARVRELGIEARVEFAGELSGDALATQYGRADVFVLATRYEGYGMVVAEALAHGLPVVATDTGCIGALLADGGGIVVAPGDAVQLAEALRRVIGDDSERQALRARARERGEGLPTWGQTADVFEAVLARMGG